MRSAPPLTNSWIRACLEENYEKCPPLDQFLDTRLGASFYVIHYRAAQARIQGGGGIWGTCPPLEPNAQRKNLRRLKDLRGQIHQKSPKFSKWFFFCLRHSLKSTLQFGIRKNVICERKVCLSAAPPMRSLFLVQTDFSVTWVTA